MLNRILPIGIVLAGVLSADTLVTRSGRTVEGTYLGGTARQVRMDTGERVETFNVSDVKEIHFVGGEPTSAAAVPAPAPPPAPAAPEPAPPERTY